MKSAARPAAGAELLLADPSPCLRLMVLRTLLGRPSPDPEVKELERLRRRDPLYADLVRLQEKDGSWSTLGRDFHAGRIFTTSMAVARLAFLGFGPDDAAVKKAADFLFRRQLSDGSWPLSDEYGEPGDGLTMSPLQTALPLGGLSRAGFAEDPRAEKAYAWLLSKRLEDGAWPAGLRSGVYRGIAGYRRLPHSRWGCRTGTTAAVVCLSLHPGRRRSAEARQAMDHLMARETREASTVGFDAARLLGFEKARGELTFYQAFDPALILSLCARMGITVKEDERAADLARFIRSLAMPSGLWEYSANLAASRWVSFDIARSLTAVEEGPSGDWTGSRPRTPFAPYPRRKRRY